MKILFQRKSLKFLLSTVNEFPYGKLFYVSLFGRFFSEGDKNFVYVCDGSFSSFKTRSGIEHCFDLLNLQVEASIFAEWEPALSDRCNLVQ